MLGLQNSRNIEQLRQRYYSVEGDKGKEGKLFQRKSNSAVREHKDVSVNIYLFNQ